MESERKGPLAGVKVVELCHVMAGPVCGLMLADMGAEVIKVERAPGGDSSRQEDQYTIAGESTSFLMVNRNKRGIAIDLKSKAGKDVLHRLLADADVVLENFRPGVMERLGFGYQALHERYPRLIYCAVSGFGRSGPLSDQPGFDLIAQGMSGLMSYTGEGEGRPPVKCGAPVTDILAGILCAMGVVAALHHRAQTGQGQMVESSLLEAGIVLSYWQSAIAFAGGGIPGPMGSGHPLSAPYQAFQTADGHITLGAANQANWERLVDALGAQRLGQDGRFRDNTARMENLAALEVELGAIFKTRGNDDWLAFLKQAGIPAGPILNVAEMHRHPQALAREMIVEVEHSRAGPVPTLGLPVKFTETPGGPTRGAPLLGEHTREILGEHGLGEAEIERLIAEGAVAIAR